MVDWPRRGRALVDCYTAEQLHGASLISGYHDAAIEIDQDLIGLTRPGVRDQEMQAMTNVGPAMSAGDSDRSSLPLIRENAALQRQYIFSTCWVSSSSCLWWQD